MYLVVFHIAISTQLIKILRFTVICIVNSKMRIIGLSRFASHSFFTPHKYMQLKCVHKKNQSQLLFSFFTRIIASSNRRLLSIVNCSSSVCVFVLWVFYVLLFYVFSPDSK